MKTKKGSKVKRLTRTRKQKKHLKMDMQLVKQQALKKV